MVFVKAIRDQMVPSCVVFGGEMDNRATAPFGHCPSTVFSLFGHIARMTDETDAKKILTASPNWRRPPRRLHTTWMKTTQQDLKSNKLSLTEAVDMAQNHPLWRLMSMFGATHS